MQVQGPGSTHGEPLNSALSGVGNVLAVASAKGGVGKSTVCVNLALGLVRTGARVGVLDGDIYGPSIPRMMGTRLQPEVNRENLMLPVIHQGLALMSIGLLTEQQTPVVWRGPLLAQALQQFLSQVEWGELDYLLIDLPPGTGDIQLTLSQQIDLAGVVVVTTPQDVALADVERGVAMFQRVEVEVIGLVENMSYFICPHCAERHQIFGADGARNLAERLNIPLLGQIPLMAGHDLSDGDGSRSPADFGDRLKPQVDEIVSRLISELDSLTH